jgi:alkylation response protein AidB-like acyl-CoA dehydrogenase
MNFSFTEEQGALRDQTLEFARAELGADLRARDREATFSRADWERCAARGVLGSHIPQCYGGQGLDAVTTVMLLEALGYGCRDNGLSLALGGQMWSVQEPILVYGSEEQKQRFLPRLCSGEWIGAHGVSEENSGSDALALQTTARRVKGGYVLDGRKTYIGMAPLADVALVLANSDPEAGKWGVSAFLVESERDGFSRSAPRGKSGTRTNPLGDLVLEECFVPEENRVGREGVGLSLFTHTIKWERAFIHAGHLGAMQFLLDRCVEYAQQRQQFGRPIGAFQSVSNRIADMRLRQETSRLLMYKVAALKDQGFDASIECAMAKLHIAESLLASATDAVRIHGARGYLEEFEVERELRDSLGGVIYAGTSDIQRNLIFELMGRK